MNNERKLAKTKRKNKINSVKPLSQVLALATRSFPFISTTKCNKESDTLGTNVVMRMTLELLNITFKIIHKCDNRPAIVTQTLKEATSNIITLLNYPDGKFKSVITSTEYLHHSGFFSKKILNMRYLINPLKKLEE